MAEHDAMARSRIRIFVKVPRSSQVAEASWTDATYIVSIEVESEALVALMKKNTEATIIGGELVEVGETRG